MSHGDNHSLLRLIRAASAAEAVVISVVRLVFRSQQGRSVSLYPEDVKHEENSAASSLAFVDLVPPVTPP